MSYTVPLPVSGQSLGNSRPLINANFTLIQSVFDNNHVDFNLANAGCHTYVDLLSQSSDSNPETTIVSHYSKSVSGNTEWFFQRENSGPVIQMSTIYGIPVSGTSGRTFLPGGLILLWGRCNYNTSSSLLQSFQGSGFPNACFSMQTTLFQNISGSAVSLTAVINSSTQFTITAKSSTSTGSSPGAYYWAIGN